MPSLHVDAAAWAAVLAVKQGDPGIYNLADDSQQLDTHRAREKLGWSPDFRAR